MGEDVGRYGGCFAVSRGMLEEFGPERIRDTPLSESGFVGAGIGAAMGGLRPIVEVMTCNFSLLPLDQIVNNAATWLHMSGGQFNCPVVIRMATGGGKQLAAQHSHSFEGWYAHIPGITILTPATLEDARGMLWTALEDPDPVLIFENQTLYPMEGLAATPVPSRLSVRASGARAATSRSSLRRQPVEITRRRADARARASKPRSSTCARCARSTTRPSSSRARTHRAVIVDEGWRSGGISAEIGMRIMESAFYELEAPVEASAPLRFQFRIRNISKKPRSASRDDRLHREEDVAPWVNSRCRASAPTWRKARSSRGT
jgi:pyruvate/2-oxoglutarate/acetoin dehydrogenase E1 component